MRSVVRGIEEVPSPSAVAHRHCALIKVSPETPLPPRSGLPDAKLSARVRAGCAVSPGRKAGSQNLALSLIM